MLMPGSPHIAGHGNRGRLWRPSRGEHSCKRPVIAGLRHRPAPVPAAGCRLSGRAALGGRPWKLSWAQSFLRMLRAAASSVLFAAAIFIGEGLRDAVEVRLQRR